MKLVKSSFFLFLIVLLVITGCSGLKEVKIGKVKDVEFKGINNNVITLAIVVPVENPNPYRIKIKSSDLKVLTGDRELGKVKQMEDILIDGKSSRDYPVQVSVELTDIKSSIMSVYKLFNSKIDLRLTGKVKVRYLFYSKTFKMEDYQLAY
jgi:LEA14-like dessication related protein